MTRRDLSRRSLIAGTAALAGAATWDRAALAQTPAPNAQLGTPPSTITIPPRDWAPGHPAIYPDPDIVVVDPAFRQLFVGNAGLHRLWTGAFWAEGPAWSCQGQYLVFSDVQANIQYRYIWDDGRVTPFRRPSQNSNGNAFDFQGRQLSCEDFTRRVVRWEHDGSLTVIADNFEGKPLNSPNDIVPHPDGSIWFTDPPYGDRLSEGHPDEAGGPTNPQGLLKPGVGKKRELPNAVYRWDPSGKLEVVVTEAQLPDPNGLCFSPDYKILYVISTGAGPGDTGPGGKREIYAFDVQEQKLANMRLFSDMMFDGIKCGPDGMRADVAGNLWCGSNAPLGYAGLVVLDPKGKLLGRIRLPEVCANLAFGGPKRDRVFMTASQSLYVLQVGIQGAAPG
jgi:gluconolactonase